MLLKEHKNYLQKIQPTIQQIVTVISSVLHLELEVADANLFRIAGTGKVKPSIWRQMDGEDAIFSYCLSSVEPVIVENPGYHSLCANCPHRYHCPEMAEVCVPILLRGEAIGVVGLIAFTPQQRELLIGSLHEHLSFLEKFSEMIAAKVNEDHIMNQQLLTEKKLTTLIDYINTGIIIFNEQNQCELLNDHARRELGLEEEELLPPELCHLFLAQQSKPEEDSVLEIAFRGVTKKLLVHIHPLAVQQNIMGKVIILTNPQRIAQMTSELEGDSDTAQLFGKSTSIENIKHTLIRLAQNTFPLLITGENGTGKSRAALFLHRSAQRKKDTYHKVNAAFYSDEEFRNVLFGTENQNGILATLDGGTLVIEEANRIGTTVQTLLYYYLDNHIITNGSQSSRIDTQIVFLSATPLLELVQQGLFRQDLYYKIAVFPIDMPPLRERVDDVVIIANAFLERLNHMEARQMEKHFSPQVFAMLTRHDWPGNIQELENVIQYAYQMAATREIEVHHFPDYLIHNIYPKASIQHTRESFNLAENEKAIIQQALQHIEHIGGTRDDAARLLGIGRATLFRKMNEYELTNRT